jgi:thiol:disulfide interchange protein DsbD
MDEGVYFFADLGNAVGMQIFARAGRALGLALAMAVLVPRSTTAAPGLFGGFGGGGPELWLADDTAKAGSTVTALIHIKMPADNHTYWRNPGESGTTPAIKWTLPPGITNGPIQWPVPTKEVTKSGGISITTYDYLGEGAFVVPLQLAGNLPPGPLELKAHIDWQQCDPTTCVQKRGDATATLTIGDQEKPSAHAEEIQKWLARLPKAKPEVALESAWIPPLSSTNQSFKIELDAQGRTVDFFPYRMENLTVNADTKVENSSNGVVRLVKSVDKDSGEWPGKIMGLLVYNAGTPDATGYETELDLSKTAGPLSVVTPPVAAGGAQLSLVTTLFFAFVGGLILNIMPCVLPVIALKVLSFVRKSQESPARVRQMGIVYGLGVIASFVVLAGVAIGIQKAGGLAGWGSVFQNPQFRVVMVVLITLVALNLFGVFEVTLGSSTLTAASELTRKEGAAGAFFNGVLATLLATPCTAPFLSVALAFAFTQPPLIISLTFVSIGVGLALPFVVVCWSPGFRRFMPKPGDWMVRFKVMMGFPMVATAVWLFWATAPRFGKAGVLWFGLFLVVLAMAAYMWGEFVQRGERRRTLAAILSLATVAGGYFFAMEENLDWRHPNRSGQAAIKWEAWSDAAVEKARRAGHAVLVDFTADTCLTCQVNKRSSLEIPATRRKLEETGTVALVGDYTDEDPAIANVLKMYDRPGVPLVLLYPKDISKPPVVLPFVLTPGIVADALDAAAK